MDIDCLVVIGHSIERVSVGLPDRKRTIWKPTRYFQTLKPNSGFRTGRRDNLASPQHSPTILGGGTAVVRAAVELFESFKRQGNPIRLIIWAAGRPKYLEELAPDNPELTEGRPMKEFFDRLTGFPAGTDAEAIILAKNRDTYDDVFVSLKTAQERGFSRVAFLAIEIRQMRLRELIQAALAEIPEFSALDVEYAVAEEVLQGRYSKVASASRLFKNIREGIKATKAWEETERRELDGVAALREKRYSREGIYGGRY